MPYGNVYLECVCVIEYVIVYVIVSECICQLLVKRSLGDVQTISQVAFKLDAMVESLNCEDLRINIGHRSMVLICVYFF